MSVKVIAIGNRLMGDDGIGITVGERIYESLLKKGIELIIGETDFEYCLGNISSGDILFIIDAIYNEKNSDVSVISIEECLNKGMRYSQHSINLIGLLELYNIKTRIYVICIGVKNISFNPFLSKELEKDLDLISKCVLKNIDNIINKLG